MKVYVLVWHENHHDRDTQVLGVFTTEAKAKEARERKAPYYHVTDWFSIEEVDLDGGA